MKKVFCPICCQSHKLIQTTMEDKIFNNNKEIVFVEECNYCPYTDQYYETEEQMTRNYEVRKQIFQE